MDPNRLLIRKENHLGSCWKLVTSWGRRDWGEGPKSPGSGTSNLRTKSSGLLHTMTLISVWQAAIPPQHNAVTHNGSTSTEIFSLPANVSDDTRENETIFLVVGTSLQSRGCKWQLAQVEIPSPELLMFVRAVGRATITFDPHFASSQISPCSLCADLYPQTGELCPGKPLVIAQS